MNIDGETVFVTKQQALLMFLETVLHLSRPRSFRFFFTSSRPSISQTSKLATVRTSNNLEIKERQVKKRGREEERREVFSNKINANSRFFDFGSKFGSNS